MFDLGFNVEVKGFDEYIATLDKLDYNMNNLEKPLKQVGDYFIKKVKSGFQSGTDPYNDDWDAITQMALNSRQVTKNDATPLTDTGVMKNSNSLEVAKNGFVLSNTDSNSYIHQLGIGKVPVRLIFPIESRGLPASWENYMINTVTKHIMGNL